MAKKKSKKDSAKKDKKKKEKKSVLAKMKAGKKKDKKKHDKKKHDKKKKALAKGTRQPGLPARVTGPAANPATKAAANPATKTVANPATKAVAKPATKAVAKPAAAKSPATRKADRSTNYKIKEAGIKLRAINNRDDLMAFVKGEKRVTVTKLIAAALNRLGK